ncbi:hypothetical protein CPB84DRAFT_158578 [Gymnopilus junonius]|uniref:Uncharacterized protein n=1 Tax=Gymnopilus junonius TaxID=109634 RepID=A0A9P5TJN8_GYMJU|nr:hypothetical protein CPB84DRAFT_158578 [Gymnopilus junonius]
MSNACAEIQHNLLHWVQQGLDFHRIEAPNNQFSQLPDISPQSSLAPTCRDLSTTCTSVRLNSPLRQLEIFRRCMNACRDSASKRYVQMPKLKRNKKGRSVAKSNSSSNLNGLHESSPLEVGLFVTSGAIQRETNILLPLMSPLHSKSETLCPQNPCSEVLYITSHAGFHDNGE